LQCDKTPSMPRTLKPIEDEHEIMLAALRERLGFPTDSNLITRGLVGLRIPEGATVGECCSKIIHDYLNGNLQQRLEENPL
jgi:hypothetical protein